MDTEGSADLPPSASKLSSSTATTEFDPQGTEVVAAEAPPGQPRSKLWLEVVGGVDSGASVVSEDKILHIGSQPGNALCLKDPSVSRIHLELSNTPEGIAVRDLASTNGTYAAGMRISKAVVSSGQVLHVGRSHVRVVALEERVVEPLSSRAGFGEMRGGSAAMRAVFALLERVAPTDETVLISGETGTGKELCARSIVAASRRAQQPCVVFDCGATPPSLLESELFGHVRGAFTGAVSDHVGAFERANGGTIFFDEVGELPLAVQTRLLRAIENRVVRRVGDTRDISLDIRIVAATNRRLEEDVNSGAFRADLYYRLSVVQVRLPALRQRPEDIPALVEHLLRKLGIERNLDDATLEQLRGYRWPGNVRELRNHLRRMELGDTTVPGQSDAGGQTPAPDLALPFKQAKQALIDRFEQDYLRALLQRTGPNLSEAARVAEIDRTYVVRLMAKHRLGRP